MKPMMTLIFKRLTLLTGLFVFCLPGQELLAGQADAASAQFSLIPAPLFIATGESGILLEEGSYITVPDDSETLEQVQWISKLINQHTGLTLRPTIESIGNAAIRLEIITESELIQRFEQAGLERPGNLREAYALSIGPTTISIQAAGKPGLFYAMTTLWQLLTADSANTGKLPALKILDAPQFEWRGLMLDSARHMQSSKFIKSYIDWMSLHKMNVFHWHLTDDQAWRLEIKAYPKLAKTGGYRVPAGAAPAADIDAETGKPRLYGGYYSQDEVRDIVAHAARRNITVVPEIDVPGHATAAIAAYPELGVRGHQVNQVPASWGIYNNVFNLEESTFEFLETVVTEVVGLFPGTFIHLGGDEVKTDQWKSSERITQRMIELGIDDFQSLQNYYVERLQKLLDQYDRRVIGWDEILESDLPENAAVMSWRGVEGAIEAAAKGHQTVLSPAPTLYLDHIQNLAVDAPPGRGGVISVREIYEFDPLPDTLADNSDLLLGVQGNLWTEHIRTHERVEYMTWPRASAIAELGWTTAEQRQWDAFSDRLSIHMTRLTALGITAASQEPVTPTDNPSRREDRELELCSNGIALALEDDAPLQGERESFLFDINNPCWIWRGADLSSVTSVSAAVGQLPFNFEIGDDIKGVIVETPTTAHGELNVRLGLCDGPVIAILSLAPAIENQAVTILPAAPLQLTEESGQNSDLCFSFSRHGIDPMWAIDWVQLNREGQ
jgi:hexosaminidase